MRLNAGYKMRYQVETIIYFPQLYDYFQNETPMNFDKNENVLIGSYVLTILNIPSTKLKMCITSGGKIGS